MLIIISQCLAENEATLHFLLAFNENELLCLHFRRKCDDTQTHTRRKRDSRSTHTHSYVEKLL